MTDQQESVKQLFEAALDMTAERRSRYLDEACVGDVALKNTVMALLAAYANVGSFLERPLLEPADAEVVRFSPGTLIGGRFIVVRFLASGGMGAVYEVEDTMLQNVRLALKVVLPGLAASAGARRRLEHEVLLARQIQHPNLCPIYDLFHCETPAPAFSFLTMKLIEGETLHARLKDQAPLPAEEADAVCEQMLAGLAAVHGAGIMHRDIKPGNVMLCGEGAAVRVWITDFGIARSFATELTALSRELCAGTMGYMAPELLRGGTPSKASDVYALGVLLHEVYTGQRPPADRKQMADRQLRAHAATGRMILEFLADNPERRVRAFATALHRLPPRSYAAVDRRRDGRAAAQGAMTRHVSRRFVLGAVTGTVACAVTAKLGARHVEDWLHPLPSRRFVALLIWPPVADAKIEAVLLGVLDRLESDLSRAEAYDRDFFVTAPTVAPTPRTAAEMDALRDALGTNLVLAASASTTEAAMRLTLAVLGETGQHVIRHESLNCRLGSDEMGLGERAATMAAELLGVSRHGGSRGATPGGTHSPEAFAAFQRAEALRKKDNDSGLPDAIASYKAATEIDPNYALAYARLAFAYGRQYEVQHDPAVLNLARRNVATARTLAPDMPEAYISQALLCDLTGEAQQGLLALQRVLAMDPANSIALFHQAQAYDVMNRWPDAERAVNHLLVLRPNLWQGYNELGALFYEQGKYRDALDTFRTAAINAPKVSMLWTNAALAQLGAGQAEAAMQSAQKSLALGPTSAAATAMAAALCGTRRYADALQSARKAVQLDPGDAGAWFTLGDCAAFAGGEKADVVAAYRHASAILSEQLQDRPHDGPSWMELAASRALSGDITGARAAMTNAEALPVNDLDTRLLQARCQEALGMRDDALRSFGQCFHRGAGDLQVALMPECDALRKDARYRALLAGREALPSV